MNRGYKSKLNQLQSSIESIDQPEYENEPEPKTEEEAREEAEFTVRHYLREIRFKGKQLDHDRDPPRRNYLATFGEIIARKRRNMEVTDELKEKHQENIENVAEDTDEANRLAEDMDELEKLFSEKTPAELREYFTKAWTN